VFTEDLVFPVPRLAEAVTDLQSRFRSHGYEDAIIFGHAKDGNLHFNLSSMLNDQREVVRLGRFLDDVLAMVREKYDSTLKGKHGTGRAISAYLESEWGSNGMAIMRDIKSLFDPSGLLNPGVIINPDAHSHISNIKDMPEVEAEIDRCIECGYCEPHCPSRRLTLTLRQRIVARREITRQRNLGTDAPLLASLIKDFEFRPGNVCCGWAVCLGLPGEH
jgi:D-lactate dehydrogenase